MAGKTTKGRGNTRTEREKNRYRDHKIVEITSMQYARYFELFRRAPSAKRKTARAEVTIGDTMFRSCKNELLSMVFSRSEIDLSYSLNCEPHSNGQLLVTRDIAAFQRISPEHQVGTYILQSGWQGSSRLTSNSSYRFCLPEVDRLRQLGAFLRSLRYR